MIKNARTDEWTDGLNDGCVKGWMDGGRWRTLHTKVEFKMAERDKREILAPN